jgi:hypothetical protein
VSAVAIVILAAILGGVIQASNAALDRKREGRAAALVIGDALNEALERNFEPQRNPFRPVLVDHAAYAVAWETERKALARIMSRDDYNVASKAFSALRTLAKKEATGHDLRDEVFDSLYHAALACELGRRAMHRYAQSDVERLRQWLIAKRDAVVQRREYRKMGQAWRRAREAEDPAS